MSENSNLKTIDTVDTSPFKKMVMTIGELPTSFIESMTYYELLTWLCDYLENTVIPAVNNNAEALVELQNLFIELRNFVNHYFDNLDVQKEIDNKLDEMFANGQLDLLFSKYVNNYVNATNTRLNNLEEKVDALNDLSPTVVTSTVEMTDTSKIYLNITNGYWYYYNGTNFVQGGLYNSDATDTAIKWYTGLISTNYNNLINPFTAAVGALKSADGSYDSTNTNYWVTDYIPIDQTQMIVTSNFLRIGGLIYNNAPTQFYKVCYYDSEQTLITLTTTPNVVLHVNTTDVPDYENIAYMRIQFSIASIPFNSRYKTLLAPCDGVKNFTGVQLSTSRFNAVDNEDIKSGAIESSRFTENLYLDNKYNMFKNSIMPFNITDFGYGTIGTADGATTYVNDRINTCSKMLIPAGTSIKLNNDWKMLAFNYSINNEYLGRFVSNWTDNIYFPTDLYVRFAFRNDTIGTFSNITDITNLISNINTSKSEGAYIYKGDKITLAHKFGAFNTGLPNFGQDSACYNNNYITFNNEGYYQMYTMNGDLLKSTTALDQQLTYAPHANSVCFGNERYAEDDIYPLLYVNAYNNTYLPLGACYVYRLLDNMTTSLQQQIIVNFTQDPIWAGDGTSVRPYGNFVVDTDHNALYAYVMIDSLQVTRFFKFDLPTLADGSIIRLEKADIKEYFDIEWMSYMQGCCYFNNKIYATCGFTSEDCQLYVVDVNTKSVVSQASLGGFLNEPETAMTYDNNLYISSNNAMFRLEFN